MMDFETIEKEIKAQKKEVIEKIVDFSFTDVLLFWSSNDEIKKVQIKKWEPVLHWLGKRFDFNLEKTETLTPPKNNEQNRQSFEEILSNMTIRCLTAFYLAALRMKSPLLALCLVEQQIDASEAFELAFLEELEQSRRWGEDKEAAEARHHIKKELLEIEEYLKK